MELSDSLPPIPMVSKFSKIKFVIAEVNNEKLSKQLIMLADADRGSEKSTSNVCGSCVARVEAVPHLHPALRTPAASALPPRTGARELQRRNLHKPNIVETHIVKSEDIALH